jgi:hypothetical protein
MRPDVLEDGYARIQEFVQQKIAETKNEQPPELTPEQKFEKDLRDSKVDKPKKPSKVTAKSGK